MILEREEYIEQAHFFRSLVERMDQNMATQDILAMLREEALASTRLPLAIDYMASELRHSGGMAPAMAKLGHYFTAFQTYVVSEAENERSQFDIRVGLSILQHDAAYRAESPKRQGVFLYQFEALCRNRLGYDRGLAAVAEDPLFDDAWKQWVLTVRRQIGIIDLASLIYVRCEYYGVKQSQRGHVPTEEEADTVVLFGQKEGQIALANRGKEPLLLFSAMQRQLGYPGVPRQKPVDQTRDITASLSRRVERLETRLKFLEDEQRKGGINLEQFYGGAGLNPPTED